MEPIVDLSPAQVQALEGRIVAAVAGSDSETFGFLKRLGPEIAPMIRIFESIGLNGTAACIAVGEGADPASQQTMKLDRLWRVRGVLRPPRHWR